jgi:hypothetical protein
MAQQRYSKGSQYHHRGIPKAADGSQQVIAGVRRSDPSEDSQDSHDDVEGTPGHLPVDSTMTVPEGELAALFRPRIRREGSGEGLVLAVETGRVAASLDPSGGRCPPYAAYERPTVACCQIGRALLYTTGDACISVAKLLGIVRG